MKIVIIPFLFLILFVYQPKAILSDDRNAYTGNYFCSKTCKTLDQGFDIKMIDDTVTINISKDDLDSVLNIRINQVDYKVKLRNNALFPIHPNDMIHGSFISTDSISFGINLRSHIPYICRYMGRKI